MRKTKYRYTKKNCPFDLDQIYRLEFTNRVNDLIALGALLEHAEFQAMKELLNGWIGKAKPKANDKKTTSNPNT